MTTLSVSPMPPRMNSHVQEVMSLIGWNEKAYVPIANAANRQLMDDIRRMQHDHEHKSMLDEQLRDRVEWLKQHLDNSGQDIQRNLMLIDVHRGQCEDEKHRNCLAVNEEASYQKEMKDFDRVFDELKRLSTFTEDELCKLNAKIDGASADIQWLRSALTEWNEATKNGEEVNAIMEQMAEHDDKVASSLETKRRKIQQELVKQRQCLHEAHEEQRALEKILDNTAQMYNRAHVERQDLVANWRRAVTELHARERAVRDTIEEIGASTRRSDRKMVELSEQNDFLDQQLKNNRETEDTIAEINTRAVALRTQNTRVSDAVVLQTNELITLKKMVRSFGHQLQRARQVSRQHVSQIDERQRLIANIKTQQQEMQEKLRKFGDLNATAQDRLRSLDELVEAEEKSVHNLNLEIARMGTALYRSQQILQQWDADYKLLQNDINVVETTIKALAHSKGMLQKDIKQQTEIMFDVKYRLLEIENRIARMKGISVTVDPETVAKLTALQHRYETILKENQLVHCRVADLQDNIRKLQTLLEQDTATNDRICAKRKERQLYYEGATKQLAKARDLSHENLVENSLIKMRLHQMDQRHQRLMENAYNLERHRCELELAINERLLNIQAEVNVLSVRQKVLQEERGQLRADIGERRKVISTLVSRFELANHLLGLTEDGQGRNTVQLRIQIAQEKELLLDQGSVLNDKVIAAEHDINALENTLIMMNYSNDKYKQGLDLVHDIDEDLQADWTALNDQLARSRNALKNLKANMALKSRAIHDIKMQCDEIEKELEDINRSRIDSSDNLMKIHSEIFEQKSKRERAERELKTVRRTASQKIDDRGYLANFERDIKARELEERNTSALQQLSDMADAVMGLGPIVTKHLYEKGLHMPSIAASSTRSDLMHATGAGSQRSMRSLRSQSRGSNSSQSGISSRSEAKSTRTLEKRASVVTLDFLGDESVRSYNTNRSNKK